MRFSRCFHSFLAKLKKHAVLLIFVAVMFILMFPFPRHEEHMLNGTVCNGSETSPCQIVIDGILYRPVLAENQFRGTFSISTEAYSLGDSVMQAIREDHQVSFMFYSDSNGMTAPGYFVAPDDYAWVYIRLNDGREIAACQQGTPNLEAIRQSATKLYGRALPE